MFSQLILRSDEFFVHRLKLSSEPLSSAKRYGERQVDPVKNHDLVSAFDAGKRLADVPDKLIAEIRLESVRKNGSKKSELLGK